MYGTTFSRVRTDGEGPSFAVTIWHNPRRNIVEVWVPTSQLPRLPSDAPAITDSHAVSSRWSDLISNAPNVAEMYFKALAVETNVRDGVFRISQRVCVSQTCLRRPPQVP